MVLIMSYMKRFIISGSAFQGWHCDIDLNMIHCNEDIATEVRMRLRSWIDAVQSVTGQDDMYGLVCAEKALKLYFHNMSFDEILTSPMEAIYLCDCDSHA